MPFGRRPPQRSTAGRTLERLAGSLPGSARKPRGGTTGGGGKGTAGLAALAAVGALAFKNREKVAALLQRARPRHDVEPPTVGVAPGAPTDPTGRGAAPAEATGMPDRPA
jgi:hypothetical protein